MTLTAASTGHDASTDISGLTCQPGPEIIAADGIARPLLRRDNDLPSATLANNILNQIAQYKGTFNTLRTAHLPLGQVDHSARLTSHKMVEIQNGLQALQEFIPAPPQTTTCLQ